MNVDSPEIQQHKMKEKQGRIHMIRDKETKVKETKVKETKI